ncbi:MAG: hypothetical protein WCQ50_15815 [Spirochaetota bacterium]
MKRTTMIIIAVGLIAVMVPGAFAQPTSSDVRALGMAGAMTAVTDDMNTLFYNPAGLSFLRKAYLGADMNTSSSINQGLLAVPVLPDVRSRLGGHNYAYYDSFLGSYVPFDFGIYRAEISGLMNESTFVKDYDSSTEDEKFQFYRQYFALRATYDSLGDIGPVELHPRLTLGGRYWGLALVGDYRMDPVFTQGYQGHDTVIDVAVERNLGGVAGVGIQLGPLALGANVRYINTSSYVVPFGLDGLIGLAGGRQQDLSTLSPLLYNSDGLGPVNTLQAGLGIMFTMGMMNLSAYNANVLPFLDKANSGVEFGTAFLNTMNLGLSFMPSDDKFNKRKFPLVFTADMDFRNAGDERKRELSAGMEAGLNAGEFLVALVRIGYGQHLPGKFADMIREFDPELGYVTGGVTAKLALVKVEVAASLPTGMAFKLGTYGSMTAAQREESMGSLGINVSLGL